MKKTYFLLNLLLLVVMFSSCNQASRKMNLSQIRTFHNAEPVWAAGQDTVKNQTLSFREIISANRVSSAYIRLAASTDYRLHVNGKFVAHGPCVAAHDFYRIDCYDIASFMQKGENVVAVEVAGYNEPSYYLLNQPSFLQCEVELNGKVVAATGTDFQAFELKQRKSDVPRFSFQRPFTEYYVLTPDYAEWMTQTEWEDTEHQVTLSKVEAKQFIERRVAYPDYRVHDALRLNDSIYKFECNSSGFLGIHVKVDEPSCLKVSFDELLGEDCFYHWQKHIKFPFYLQTYETIESPIYYPL